MIERRKAQRRKGGERRTHVDPKYSVPEKDKRRLKSRRKGVRRKNISTLVTCRECGNLFLITKDDFYRLVQEGKPVLCPKGCKKDNTKIAKTALFMVERGRK